MRPTSATRRRLGYASRVLARGRWRPGWTARWFALAFVLLLHALPRLAHASPEGLADQPRPVIVPGREDEVLALLQPYALGDALAPDWALHSVSIDVGTITVWIVGPDERYARLTLDHREHGPPSARMLTGFAMQVVEQPPGSEAAMERLVAAIERNDDGSFWGLDPFYAKEPRQQPHHSTWAGDGLLQTLGTWASDGLVFFVGLVLTVLVLLRHKLRGAPTWAKWALLAITVLGAVLRLTLSPAVALAPWPYTRLLVSARMIFNGPGLAMVHPGPVWLSEMILASTLALSLLAPLAVYVHARYLLDDHRAGLLAALVIAVLPLHLRFSHSDTAFIPSITVSSIVFALIHAATREPSRRGGWLAVALVGFPLALMYEVRPLNIMYYPLLLATAAVASGLHTDKPPLDRPRSIAVLVVVSAVTFGIGVPRLLLGFGDQVDAGLSVGTLGAGLKVLFDPWFNALVNPVFSPPGLLLLAIVGVVDLWRRRRRPLLLFLGCWLLGLLVAHAYVTPKSEYMQARYHLHLVVPYSLLAVCGADAASRWLRRRREAGAPWLAGPRHTAVRLAALGYLLASPLVHQHAIRHVEFNDVREWSFVHDLRERIPRRCTVVEYTGHNADARFGRVGTWVERGIPHGRWRVVEIGSPAPGDPTLPDDVRTLLQDPPECLYWYEGLPCVGNKAVDQPKAAVCRAVEELLSLEEVASTRFASAPYDENLAKGLGDREFIELRLYRAR